MESLVFDRLKGTLAYKGDVIATGIWSGHGDAANDISRESEQGIGPLPAGVYTIGPMYDHAHLGPHVMNLTQISGNTYNRSLFRMHGDTINDISHLASDGCIIAPRTIRDLVNSFPERRIQVI